MALVTGVLRRNTEPCPVDGDFARALVSHSCGDILQSSAAWLSCTVRCGGVGGQTRFAGSRERREGYKNLRDKCCAASDL